MNPEKEQELTLEQALKALDETIDTLGSRDIPLETAFAAYESGMRLLKVCSDKIDLVEKKVMQLSEEGEIREFS